MMDCMGFDEFIASWPREFEENVDILEFAERAECREVERDR